VRCASPFRSRRSEIPVGPEDHSGRHRVIRQRIDENERARDAILGIGVDEERAVGRERDAADFIQAETFRRDVL